MKSVKSRICSHAKHKQRLQAGNLAEFAPAFSLFILFVLLPLLAGLITLLRVALAQGLLDQAAQSLSRCEKMSIAYRKFDTDEDWQSFLSLFGVKTKNKNLAIIAMGAARNQVKIIEPCAISKEWLPGGRNHALYYMMQVSATLEMSPLFPSPHAVQIPCLTSPVHFEMKSKQLWQNLRCNPETREFYINE